MSVNIAAVAGNLTTQPEFKMTQTGKSVCNFTIANNYGSDKDSVVFIRCTTWDKVAEIVRDYFGKGDKIFVQGSLRQSRWEDKETHAKRSMTYINVFSIDFAGRKAQPAPQPQGYQPQAGDYQPPQYNPNQPPQPPAQPAQGQQPPANSPQPPEPPANHVDTGRDPTTKLPYPSNDEIPF